MAKTKTKTKSSGSKKADGQKSNGRGASDEVETPGALELLELQHREVEGLFDAFEGAGDDAERQALFESVADNLAAHAAIEETIFYPAVYEGETEEILREAVEEHLAMKRVLADLLAMDPDDAQFHAKMSVLKELVDHHVEEEEEELFPEIEESVPENELRSLGGRMLADFEERMAAEPRLAVPAEVDEAAPLPGG